MLSSSASFGLGILTARDMGQGSALSPSSFMANTAAVAAPTTESASTGTFVASKNGTKYYLPTCAGALKISEENKVWFKTAEEANGKGYTKAANCKGL